MLRPEPRKALRSRPEKRVRPHLQRWVSCELSLSKLQDQIPSRTRGPLLMGSPSAAQGHKSNDGPTAMKHQPRHKDHLARYGSDHRSSPEFLDRTDRCRVDEKLAIVGGGLNEKDPAVGAPNTAPSRLEPSDVQSRVLVVPGQGLVPAVVNPRPSPTEDGPKKVQLQNVGANAPEVEKAIPAGLGGEEHGHEQSDQHKRERRGGRAAEGDGQGDARCGDCPVGGRVQARAPDGAAVQLAAVKMREHADVGWAEGRLIA